MGSLDISLGTKREIQLVGLHSSLPVRLHGTILKVGQKKKKIRRTLSVQTNSPRVQYTKWV